MRKFSSVAAVILILAWSAEAGAARTTLANLVSEADVIVIGKIKSVKLDADRAIARFAVSETLKGNTTRNLFFLIPSRWASDPSSYSGEKALLFLNRPRTAPEAEPAPPAQFRGQPVFVLSWSERGRFWLGKLDGVTYASVWTDELELPADVPAITSDFVPNFIMSVPLQPLREAVRRLLAEQ
jgi:hypothetical protein